MTEKALWTGKKWSNKKNKAPPKNRDVMIGREFWSKIRGPGRTSFRFVTFLSELRSTMLHSFGWKSSIENGYESK